MNIFGLICLFGRYLHVTRSITTTSVVFLGNRAFYIALLKFLLMHLLVLVGLKILHAFERILDPTNVYEIFIAALSI